MEGVSRAYLAMAQLRDGHLPEAEVEARRAVSLLSRFQPSQPLALATLACVLLAQGSVAEALQEVMRAFSQIESTDRALEGDSLVRVVYAEALEANGQHAGARAALVAARARLLALAGRIRDEHWRRSFLDNIPENARTLALAQRWLGD